MMPTCPHKLSRGFRAVLTDLILHGAIYWQLEARNSELKKTQTWLQQQCTHPVRTPHTPGTCPRLPLLLGATAPVVSCTGWVCKVVHGAGCLAVRPWWTRKKMFYRLFLESLVGRHPLFLAPNQQTRCNLDFCSRKTWGKACRPRGTVMLAFGPVSSKMFHRLFQEILVTKHPNVKVGPESTPTKLHFCSRI